ncbi:MAG: T9SS type A sorting domain-containing protein [Candidatus Delongbacteria bacterium]|nr:T9SS type A sorting domain-containing protein [Candidatus Delongbacteria bacterium]
MGEGDVIIEKCRSNVNVLGYNYTGGLIGRSDGVISQSYSMGSVTLFEEAETAMGTGGFVGASANSISNCFSASNVIGNSIGTYGGGFVGRREGGSIENSFSYGIVTGDLCGGFSGSGYGNTINCFWDVETSGIVDSTVYENDPIGFTTTEMKTLSTFTDAGWDFVGESANGTEDIWDINGVTNNGYPFLAWMSTGIMDNEQFTVDNYKLEQNYPNPFNPTTTISFSIPSMQDVKLSVFNSNGQLVKELINGVVNAGMHSSTFNAENLNSGIYFYTLQTDGKKLSNKMLLIK